MTDGQEPLHFEHFGEELVLKVFGLALQRLYLEVLGRHLALQFGNECLLKLAADLIVFDIGLALIDHILFVLVKSFVLRVLPLDLFL